MENSPCTHSLNSLKIIALRVLNVTTPVLFRYVSVQNLTIHPSHFNKQVQMKIVANFKNGEVLGWAMTPKEMSQLHDILEDITDKQENNKVRYVLQFLWRDLTSAFDLIGPYFTCQATVTTSALSKMVNKTMYALHKFCLKVCAMVCDGASTNLALLKILCGLPNKMLDINDCVPNHQATVAGVRSP